MPQKLFLIDNKFFDKIPDTEMLIDSLITSIGNIESSEILKNSEMVYINNSNIVWDEKYKSKNIRIIQTLSDINLYEYESVIYINSPFFSIANVLSDILSNEHYQKNRIVSQEVYNLNPITSSTVERFLFSKTKPMQLGNVASLSVFTFKLEKDPDEIKFESQEQLVKFLHRKNPQAVYEFSNNLGISAFQFFDKEIDYINFCLGERTFTDGSNGIYAVYFPDEYKNVDDIVDIVMDMQNKNPKMFIDLRTGLDISSTFSEEIVEVDGEFQVQNNFKGDNTRLITSNSKLLHYDFNTINGVLDLSDKHFKHILFGGPKYMKVYNSEYKFLYQISKEDILSAKVIDVKRTMGMGDALLTLPIIREIKKINPNVKIVFHSLYDFSKYLIDKSMIDYFVKLDSRGIFADLDTTSDIVLDFDLAYENQTFGGRFFDYYLNFFSLDTFAEIDTNPILTYDIDQVQEKICSIVGEGSGWASKEPNIDLIERIAYTMKEKGYKVYEPGINRITNYADETNPNNDLDKVFKMVKLSSCYIGTDSGVSHIANLMGKPSFIIGGSADPNKTQFNVNIIYPFGRTDLLCYGCRHFSKGFRTLENGTNTFVSGCHNVNQFQCMKDLDVNMAIEDLDNFLIKFDL